MSLPVAGATSLWIGWRYLVHGRRAFVSLITWVSVLGLGLGVAVLVVVISVMNGFDNELHHRILSTVPHVVVTPPADVDPAVEARVVAKLDRLAPTFPFFEAEGMISRGGGVEAVAVYGIDAQGLRAMTVVADHMSPGAREALIAGHGGVVIGTPLARHLGVDIGDAVTLVLSTPSGSTVVPQLQRFTLVGTFEVGAELDYELVLIGLGDVTRRHLEATGRTGYRMKLADPLEIAAARERIDPLLPPGWHVSDWRSDYGALFRAVSMEKSMMFVLLALIVAIAAFNIVSAQTMLVNEKRSDIAILRTMGASEGLIVRLVLVQGILVALVGIGVGLALGLLLAHHVTEAVGLLETLIGARLLDGTYFSQVPSQVQLGDIVVISVVSFGFCVLSALHPARRAAALNPADALHEP
jgi:lipoprotein-releasing system permease protein